MSDHQFATRGRPRVALVTCAALPDLDPDDRLLIAPLARRGLSVDPVPWDAPGVDWSGYHLVVLRSPWDYAARRAEFVSWAVGVPRLANPADVIRWNTDKRYLGELAAASAPTVPTSWVEPGGPWSPPAGGEFVIKPAVGAGSRATGRYDLADAGHRRLAAAHLARLGAAGRHAMVQPYLGAVDTAGETSLLFFAGPTGPSFSHAIRRSAILTGPDDGRDEVMLAEEVTPAEATPAQRAVADRVLAGVPGGAGRLLYARVDLIPGPDGAPVLVELELTEPSLFLGHAEGAAERLAAAVARSVAAG